MCWIRWMNEQYQCYLFSRKVTELCIYKLDKKIQLRPTSYIRKLSMRLCCISDILLLNEHAGFHNGLVLLILFKNIDWEKKGRLFNLETHLAFTDWEKVLDRADRSILWDVMCKSDFPTSHKCYKGLILLYKDSVVYRKKIYIVILVQNENKFLY